MEIQSPVEQSVRSLTVGGGSSKAFCKCGQGWKCVITRIEGSKAGKAFFKCGQSCTFVIDGEGTVKELEKLGPNEAYCECGEGRDGVVSSPRLKGPKLTRHSSNVLMAIPVLLQPEN